jgi:acyl-CoA synthetase (NDP forming)
VRYGEWRRAPAGVAPELPGIDADGAAATIAGALLRGGGWLTGEEVERLLAWYGLTTPPSQVVRSARAAGLAADRLGGPVALKALGPGVLHKTDVGAIRLGLTGRARVERAAKALRTSLIRAGHPPDGFIVQQMVEGGVEMLVGVVHDPLFGPVVAVGAGGTAAELINDVRVGLTPLTDLDARAMLRSLATFPLLDGFRGAPKADLSALEDVILRVGAMVENHAEIAELDLNPVIALPDGARVVDARIRVEPAPAARPLLARRSI